MYGHNTSFITHMKVVGALHKPKGITNHSNSPCLVLNEVFQMPFSAMQILLYPLHKSNLVK